MTVRAPRTLRMLATRLGRNVAGLAAVEFALAAPIMLTIVLSGLEIANFTITKMRMSQLALHIADNGSRIGTASLLTNPQISEAQINDLITGADLQSQKLGLLANGRVIISSLEPDTSNSGKYYIHWQRCAGSKTWPSSYGVQGDNNMAGMGPAGRQVTAPAGGGVIYVEIAYNYQPLVSARLAPTKVIKEVAAMTVRDDRDYSGNSGSGVYNTEGVTASSCT